MTKTAPLIDIREDHWDIVQGILQKHVPQYEVWAFGSRAKWTAKQYSDLDLALITDKPLSLDISASLSDDFSESDLPYKVDIVDWATTSESFRKIIEQDKVVVQTRKPRLGMVDRWRSSNWGDEVTLEYGKAIRGYSQLHGKYRVFGSNGPIGWTSEALTHGPGVVLGRKGAYRGVEFCHDPFWVIDTAYYVVPKTDLDMRWLYYAVKHYKLGEVDDGSPIPSTTRAAVYMLELDVPPKHEQRAIAHILGTLDDKIELNRKQNETLEAMARALFKAWFVDFEPVRAKMEGRWQRGQSLPGLPAHLYDLFPDRLVDSELGEIPEGWESVPASRLVKFNPSEPLRMGTEAPYIEMAALPTSGSWPEPPVLRPFSSGMRFRNGDTLLARITPCLENGKTAFVQCLPDNTVGWGSTEYIVMRPHLPVPQEFGYLLARDAVFREQAIRSMTGTSGRQRVQADSVAAFKIAAPSNKAVWDAFSSIVTPAFMSIKANAEAIATLTQLRDTLLPKLISGELRVSEVESFIKERGL